MKTTRGYPFDDKAVHVATATELAQQRHNAAYADVCERVNQFCAGLLTLEEFAHMVAQVNVPAPFAGVVDRNTGLRYSVAFCIDQAYKDVTKA